MGSGAPGTRVLLQKAETEHLNSKRVFDFYLSNFALGHKMYQGKESEVVSLVQMTHGLHSGKASRSLDSQVNLLVALTCVQCEK